MYPYHSQYVPFAYFSIENPCLLKQFTYKLTLRVKIEIGTRLSFCNCFFFVVV